MKNPEFVLRIIKTERKQQFSCLGEQLVKILSVINESSKTYCWYAFDVKYINNNSNGLFQSPFSRFDNTDELISSSKRIEQFLSGVFIALEDETVIWDLANPPITEEKEGIQHQNAELEIRAFDTSYFEVYGLDTKLADVLKLTFQPYCQ